MKTKTRTCPRCMNRYTDYPATSRRDNKTEICSACGTEEAMVDYAFHTGKAEQLTQETALREHRFIKMLKERAGVENLEELKRDQIKKED